MKIALLGYGRMGKEIEKIALRRNHEIVIKTNGEAEIDITKADIAIDFSLPEVAFNKLNEMFAASRFGIISKFAEPLKREPGKAY